MDLMGGGLKADAYARLNTNMKVLKSSVQNFAKFAQVLDAHLEGRSHVACGRLTIADFQMASMATYWRESAMPMDAFPNIVRWLAELMRIPAWAAPGRQQRKRAEYRQPLSSPAYPSRRPTGTRFAFDSLQQRYDDILTSRIDA